MYNAQKIAEILLKFLNVQIDPKNIDDSCIENFSQEIKGFLDTCPGFDFDDETTWLPNYLDNLVFCLTNICDYINDKQSQVSSVQESNIIGAPIYITRLGYKDFLGKLLPAGTATDNINDDELAMFNKEFKGFLEKNPALDPTKDDMSDKQRVELAKIVKECRKISEAKSGNDPLGALVDKVSSGGMTEDEASAEIDGMVNDGSLPAPLVQALKYCKTAKDKVDVVDSFWRDNLHEDAEEKENIIESILGSLTKSDLFGKENLPAILNEKLALKDPSILSKLTKENAKTFLSKFAVNKLVDIKEALTTSIAELEGKDRVDENKILKTYKVWVPTDKATSTDGIALAKKIDGQYNGTAMERKAGAPGEEAENYHLITSFMKKSDVKSAIPDSFQLVEENKIEKRSDLIKARSVAFSMIKINESSMGDVLISRDTKDVEAYKKFDALQTYLESKYKAGKDYDITADGSIRLHQEVVDKDSKLGPMVAAVSESKINEHHLVVGDKVEFLAGDNIGKKGEVSATSDDGLTYKVKIEGGDEVEVGDTDIQKDQESAAAVAEKKKS